MIKMTSRLLRTAVLRNKEAINSGRRLLILAS